MRELILLRHAHAEPADTGQADFDRPLSPHGIAEAEAAGLWLREQRLVPDRVLCSPARRARETLEAVLELTGYIEQRLDERIYEATAGTVASLVDEHREAERLLLVGHNPGLERLAALMHSGQTGDYRGMPTASIALLAFAAGRHHRAGHRPPDRLLVALTRVIVAALVRLARALGHTALSGAAEGAFHRPGAIALRIRDQNPFRNEDRGVFFPRFRGEVVELPDKRKQVRFWLDATQVEIPGKDRYTSWMRGEDFFRCCALPGRRIRVASVYRRCDQGRWRHHRQPDHPRNHPHRDPACTSGRMHPDGL